MTEDLRYPTGRFAPKGEPLTESERVALIERIEALPGELRAALEGLGEEELDTPYREYSAPWFGFRKVLRGGCWATRSRLMRNSYRNFFTPERRDIYAGFRTCAR